VSKQHDDVTTSTGRDQQEETQGQHPGTSRRDFMKLSVGSAGVGAAAAYFAGAASVVKPAMAQLSSKEADKTYVAPGQYDTYYAFKSGGQSGDMRVMGLPSNRLFKRIPVFNFDCCFGWGVTNHSKRLLADAETGEQTKVGDTHHVHLSYTDGTYDGKYSWVNDKARGRLARVRLDYMEVDAITDLPHCQGTHGIFPSRDRINAVYCNSEFRNPMPNDGSLLDEPKKYGCLHTCVDAESMKVRWQVWVDGQLDICATDYHGKYSMATCYNSEEGVNLDQMTAADRDHLTVFNLERIEEAVKSGKDVIHIGDRKDIPVIDGRGKDNRYVLYIPVPKNPHGVNIDPTGTYAIASGKLSPTVSVIPLAKIDDAFAGKIKTPRDCVVAEPEVGLGPLHTAFDGRGNAYTSIFIDSVCTKWNIATAVAGKDPVLQKIDVMYQPGHVNATMSETKDADGKWLMSLNKFSKDRFLSVGPMFPDNDQFIDISSTKEKNMVLVHDAPAYPEPHDAILAWRSIFHPKQIWDPKDRKFDWERNLVAELSKRNGKKLELGKTNEVIREGNKLYAIMTSLAPVYGLQEIRAKKGDEVTVIVTNINAVEDLTHGFCLSGHDINFGVAPQETASVTFTADKKGVWWFYCTWFCHALHLEMRSRFIVS